MTRQVDLLYMKHNTSFRSQVVLAATQNSKGAGAIYRMIYEMFYFKNGTFQSTFKLNSLKITWVWLAVAVSPCICGGRHYSSGLREILRLTFSKV